MSDLTEDELRTALTVHDRLSAVNVNAYVDPDGLRLADQLQRAALELQRHRSAMAADGERVEMVVHEILNVVLTEEEPRWSIAKHQKVCQRIAARAAEQLATAGVGLSEEDRNHLLSIKSQLSYSANLWRAELATIDRLLGASK